MILAELSSFDLIPLTLLPEPSMLTASLQDFSHHVTENLTFFAQNYGEIQKIDIIQDFQKAFQNFIKSGQAWALGIGLVLGWVLHSFIGS